MIWDTLSWLLKELIWSSFHMKHSYIKNMVLDSFLNLLVSLIHNHKF